MGYTKLGRTSPHRRMMLRNIVTSLLQQGRIETTEVRAKQLAPIANKMITLGKAGTLHARRQALAYLLDESVVKRLFDEIAPRYQDRSGGYTRIIKRGYRRGDGAPMVVVELT
ncbi:MAG: 50S ribosomal protein L17 [Clostridia bacterium]|nr:MAG: 50S ribosomal protein L17 [Clostridia bacterium]